VDSTPGIRRGSSHPAPNHQGRSRFPDPAESALNRSRKSASHAAEYLTEGVVLAVSAGLVAYAAEDRRIKADILTWARLLAD